MRKNKITYLKEDEYYNTSDLGLSALLNTLGFEIVAIDKTNPKRANFVFKDSEKLQDAINRYWTSPERKYFDNLKLLKNRLYND